MKQRYEMDCSVAKTLNLIGDRWSELQDALTGIPTNLLSERLKSLERDGLLQSELYREHPPRYRYRPTGKGEALRDLFNCMIVWAQRYLPECGHRLTHTRCGGEINFQYCCSRCGGEVPADELAVGASAGKSPEDPAPLS